jgi:hypothetical protein
LGLPQNRSLSDLLPCPTPSQQRKFLAKFKDND